MHYSLVCQWLSNLEEVALPTPSLFPNSCFICGKRHNQLNKMDITATKILTLLVQVTIKTDTKNKMGNSYFQNKDLDLNAHELHFHQPCFMSFTHGHSCNFQKASSTLLQALFQLVKLSKKRRVVTKLLWNVSEYVFKGKKAVSMKVLQGVYGLCRDDFKYRSKFK